VLRLRLYHQPEFMTSNEAFMNYSLLGSNNCVDLLGMLLNIYLMEGEVHPYRSSIDG